MSDFRSAPGRFVEWGRTDGTFSNFEFVDTSFGSHPILRRILSLARKLNYGGLLIEAIDESDCALLAEENAALARRLPAFRSASVTRLSFFAGTRKEAPGAFLGYAIFRQDAHTGAIPTFTHVFEAVLRMPRGRKANNFVHCQRDYQVSTSLGQFTVRGVLYAQQNDATSVCAHVALRSLLACLLPQGDITYAEINRLAGVDHGDPATCIGGRGITGHSRGLNSPQIESILRQLGLAADFTVHEPKQPALNAMLPDGVEFQRLLYGTLESGPPVLLGFELTPNPPTGDSGRHIIPIFGHTFNEDLWVPEAERAYFQHNRGYFPSESWLSTHLAHDDNFGPYVCLPRHYLHRDQFRLLVSCTTSPTAVATGEAEALAFDFVTASTARLPVTQIPWLDRMVAFARAGLLVLRTLAVDSVAYRSHLESLRDREGFDLEAATVDEIVRALPQRFWLVEISAPELFPASRRKFGEVLIDSDQVIGQTSVLAFRAPGLVFVKGVAQRTRLAGHTDIMSLSTD